MPPRSAVNDVTVTSASADNGKNTGVRKSPLMVQTHRIPSPCVDFSDFRELNPHIPSKPMHLATDKSEGALERAIRLPLHPSTPGRLMCAKHMPLVITLLAAAFIMFIAVQGRIDCPCHFPPMKFILIAKCTHYVTTSIGEKR